MSYAQRLVIPVTTIADGSQTSYSDFFTGEIVSVTYAKTDFANGVDFTITLEATGESLWTDTDINASETVYPVAPANLGSSGAASVLLQVPLVAVNDRVKFVIASGGNTKSGTFHVVVK